MSGQITFLAEPSLIPSRFFRSYEEAVCLTDKINTVIKKVGYPKFEELGRLFSIEEPRSFRKIYPIEKKEVCWQIGQDVFDEYKEVAQDEKIAYLCLVVYFENFRLSYREINSRALEMTWNCVGGKDSDTVWFC